MSQYYCNWDGGMWHGHEFLVRAVTVALMDRLPLPLMMGIQYIMLHIYILLYLAGMPNNDVI